MFVKGSGAGNFSWKKTLRNGRLTMTFESLPEKVEVDDEFTFLVGMHDDAMPEPVTEELTLRVVELRPTRRKRPKPPIDPDAEGDEETTGGRELPPTKWLTRDGRSIGEDPSELWPDDFTDQDGGKVDDLEEDRKVYCINYDNAHFRQFLDRERNEIDKKVVTEQYRLGMLVLMMGLEDAYSRMGQDDTKANLGEYSDEIRRLAAQGASTVVMSIAKTLHTIINPASVADPDDD